MPRPSRPLARRAAGLSLGLTAVLALASLPALAKLETWRQETSAAFTKGRRDRIVIADSGRVRLGRALKGTDKLDAARVWDLARSTTGVIYAATGDSGQVYRREGDGAWSLAHDGQDSQALALAATADGRVFAGTGPTGRLVEVSDPNALASVPDPAVRYIWDLAADSQSNLYAATGPTGQLWKRSAAGAWSLLLDSKHSHLLCVAVGPDGSVYAGSDGEGLIYRVGPDGKARVMYDAPQAEVRALVVGPDGSVYAGTAVEGGSPPGSGPNRGPSSFPGAGPGGPPAVGPNATAASAGAEVLPQVASDLKVAGGTATPKPAAPGDNAVYRIGPDGAAREIFRARALVFAMALQGDRLLVGTGPEGTLYEVRDFGRESAPIARLDGGQILALLAEPDGGLLIGTGDPGSVVALGPGHVDRGTFTSDVLDAKFPARFGALSWRAETPGGTAVALQVRTGNVGEPDATWSDWSREQTDPASASCGSPPGRFAQYRAILTSKNPAATPELRSVAIRYQPSNLPPEIAKFDIPDLSAGDGATRQAKMTLKWEATDPNGDELAYTLHARKEGWPGWIKLVANPITETTYAWDSAAVPEGTYRLRLTASDRASNPGAEALERERVSEPFVVDHRAPSVAVERSGDSIKIGLRDDLTRVTKAAYALDGNEWMPIFPDDGLFDTATEAITLGMPALGTGTHIIMVRAVDAAGNVGTGDLAIESP